MVSFCNYFKPFLVLPCTLKHHCPTTTTTNTNTLSLSSLSLSLSPSLLPLPSFGRHKEKASGREEALPKQIKLNMKLEGAADLAEKVFVCHGVL
jgi:hypothetical protein